jgi:hypothetical protein
MKSFRQRVFGEITEASAVRPYAVEANDRGRGIRAPTVFVEPQLAFR